MEPPMVPASHVSEIKGQGEAERSTKRSRSSSGDGINEFLHMGFPKVVEGFGMLIFRGIWNHVFAKPRFGIKY